MDPPVMSPIARGAFVACIILPLLALCILILRFKARLMSQSKLKSDDYTMAVALTITIGTCATFAYGLYIGAAMGPPSSISGTSVVLTYELDIIIEQLYGIAEALIKISILLFYRRIFSIGRFPLIANLSIGLMSVWALLFLLLFIFPVWPITTTWIPNQPSHQNYDWTKVLLWHAITNIGLDVYILCLPLPIIRTLHMSRGRKAAVISVLGLGSFCVIASCVRLSYVVGVQSENTDTAGTGNDAVSEAALWSVIEPCGSVIAGCLPTLGPFFKGTKTGDWLSSKMQSVFQSSKDVVFVGKSFIDSGSSSHTFRKGSGDSNWRMHWPRRGSKQRSRESSIATERTNSTVEVIREMQGIAHMV